MILSLINRSVKFSLAALLLCTLCFFYSCYPDPSFETLERYTINFETANSKRLIPGEKTDVVLRVTNFDFNDDSIRVVFETIKGDGSLSDTSLYINRDELAATQWTAGGGSFLNTIRASIYNPSGKYIMSRDLNILCFTEGTWNKVTDSPDAQIMDMVADTIGGVTYMITNSTLYRQGERYYIWEKIENPIVVLPRTIEITDAGIIYISTWNGELIKSTDHGNNWSRCTKPYADNPYFFYMSVSNDGYIWVGKYNFPTRFSRDGGNTWINASYLSSFMNGNTFRLKNGDLVNHGTKEPDRNRLNISRDDGITWTTLPTPGYSTTMYVNDKDEIFIGTQLNGYSIYKSADMGVTFELIHSVYPQFGTTMESNIFRKWHNFYYVIVPGFGILKSADLEHYENFWTFPDIRDLFIDHNGVLIAKGEDWRSVYYRTK